MVSAARGSADRAGAFARRVDEIAEAAEPGATVWAVMRAATASMVETAETRGDSLRARLRMITDVPALHGHLASLRPLLDVYFTALGDVRRTRLT